MKKLYLILACLVFLGSLSFASAKLVDYKEHITITKYYSEENVAVSNVIYADYENDNRHSTYDYRHGYSYRTTKDYWDRHHEFYVYEADDYPKITRKLQQPKGMEIYHSNMISLRGYEAYDLDYTNSLEKINDKKCYHRPPSDKLFYIKCL